MTKLQITVQDQILTATPDKLLVSRSVGEVMFEATFDESWEGYTKTIVFWTPRVQKSVLYTGGEAAVPREVLDRPTDSLRVSAVGIKEGHRRPTAVMHRGLSVIANGAIEGGPPGEYSPALWEQVLGRLDDLNQQISARGLPDGGESGNILTKGDTGAEWSLPEQQIKILDELEDIVTVQGDRVIAIVHGSNSEQYFGLDYPLIVFFRANHTADRHFFAALGCSGTPYYGACAADKIVTLSSPAQSPTPLPVFERTGQYIEEALSPYLFYKWGEVKQLYLSLDSTKPGDLAIFCGQFATGATAPSVGFPADIVWPDRLEIQPNSDYQFWIINNIGKLARSDRR